MARARQPGGHALMYYAMVAAADSKPFIERVVDEAKKTFLTGFVTLEREFKKVQADESLKQKHSLYPKYKIAHLKDDKFKQWSANCIEGTSFVAGSAPVVREHLKPFFEETAFNPYLKIKKIVVLSPEFMSQNHGVGTFKEGYVYNYCIGVPESKYDDLQVLCKTHGVYGYDEKTQVTSVKGYVKSSLKVTQSVTDKNAPRSKVLSVTVIGLDDHSFIDLQNVNPEIKKMYLDLCNTPPDEKVFVHCMAGCGRTGWLILMLELTKHYNKVFTSGNHELVAKNIHDVLNRIRTTRKGLVFTEGQFISAIRNAKVLHEYRMALEYQAKLEADAKAAKEKQNPIAPVVVYTGKKGAYMFNPTSATPTSRGIGADNLDEGCRLM